jgi:hypothetical protein
MRITLAEQQRATRVRQHRKGQLTIQASTHRCAIIAITNQYRPPGNNPSPGWCPYVQYHRQRVSILLWLLSHLKTLILVTVRFLRTSKPAVIERITTEMAEAEAEAEKLAVSADVLSLLTTLISSH